MPESCDALVLFGATGDLARKRLFPALHVLARLERLPNVVVGVATRPWDSDRLRDHARAAVEERVAGDTALDEMLTRLTYVSGDYRDRETFTQLRAALGASERPLMYLAIPPSLFETVITGLAAVGLNRNARLVVEKPFGRDLASAQALDRTLGEAFPEEAIYRIDHYLGKEQVLDLLVFRLANTVLEPAWNRHYIDRVEVTMAEDFGVEGRGRFYEEVGALRDVVQNHLLQLVALVAMEPPIAADARALRDEKVKVLRSLRPLRPTDVVRGQFHGYRDEEGVAADSEVETFVALRAEIDSWRWAGVPFYLRAGKRMPVTATELVVEFKAPPRHFFAAVDAPPPHPNHLRFRFNPVEQVALTVDIKQPGNELLSRPVTLGFTYDDRVEGGRDDAYTRLLTDALEGDQRLFARADGVEAAWRVVDPVVADPGGVGGSDPRSPGPVLPYEPGTWGPPEADALLAHCGGWHNPTPL